MTKRLPLLLATFLLSACNPDGSVTIPLSDWRAKPERSQAELDQVVHDMARERAEDCLADETKCRDYFEFYLGASDLISDIELDRTPLRQLRERYARRCEAGNADGCIMLWGHLREFFGMTSDSLGIDDGHRLRWDLCHVHRKENICDWIDNVEAQYDPGHIKRLREDAETRQPLDIRALDGMDAE